VRTGIATAAGPIYRGMDRAALDAAYNNSAAVADSADYLARWRDRSAYVRMRGNAVLDLRYGGRERARLDFFSSGNAKAPLFVFIHGGYWQRNSREQFANLIAGPYARGWSAALPGYTLAPDATLTQITQELRTALDWLAANGSAHGIAGPIIISGWSAGGHLTAMCLSHPRVGAGLAISGIYELGPIRDTYLNEKLALSDIEIEILSPLRLPMIDKPLAITYGTAELPPLIADSRALHARRAAEHLPGPLIPIAGADHFTIVHQLRDADGELTRQLMLLA
jgi:acetyl esterase/lipase